MKKGLISGIMITSLFGIVFVFEKYSVEVNANTLPEPCVCSKNTALPGAPSGKGFLVEAFVYNCKCATSHCVIVTNSLDKSNAQMFCSK